MREDTRSRGFFGFCSTCGRALGSPDRLPSSARDCLDTPTHVVYRRLAYACGPCIALG